MFYITVSNGLMSDGHRKRMGEAVWEFMWLLDKITLIDEEGIGWVLGKKPINLTDIGEMQNVHKDTVSANLNKLEQEGYITKIRTPYGLIIGVKKAKKRFNAKHSENRRFPDRESAFSPNVIKTVSVDNINNPKGAELLEWNKKLFNGLKENGIEIVGNSTDRARYPRNMRRKNPDCMFWINLAKWGQKYGFKGATGWVNPWAGPIKLSKLYYEIYQKHKDEVRAVEGREKLSELKRLLTLKSL